MKQTAAVRDKNFATRWRSFCIVAVVIVSACHQRKQGDKIDQAAPVEIVIPEHGAYTGAFIDFGETEEDVTLEGIEDFEAMVGKHQAIIASSSYWGEGNFPARNLNLI